jgi:hypothetical protein
MNMNSLMSFMFSSKKVSDALGSPKRSQKLNALGLRVNLYVLQYVSNMYCMYLYRTSMAAKAGSQKKQDPYHDGSCGLQLCLSSSLPLTDMLVSHQGHDRKCSTV